MDTAPGHTRDRATTQDPNADPGPPGQIRKVHDPDLMESKGSVISIGISSSMTFRGDEREREREREREMERNIESEGKREKYTEREETREK